MSDEEEEGSGDVRIKQRRSSSVYSFSGKDLYKFETARKEGTLRFPDLFMYHIQRSTADVQREARLLRRMQSSTSPGLSYNSASSVKSPLDLEQNISSSPKLESIAIASTREESMIVQEKTFGNKCILGSFVLFGSLLTIILIWKSSGVF